LINSLKELPKLSVDCEPVLKGKFSLPKPDDFHKNVQKNVVRTHEAASVR